MVDKRNLLIPVTLALFLGGALSVYAQDLIILRDGNVIEAKVTEISPAEIRYKRANHLDGPTIVVPAPTVLSIRYSNGKVDIISALPAVAAPAPAGTVRPAPAGAAPAVAAPAGAAPAVAAPAGAAPAGVAAAGQAVQTAAAIAGAAGLPVTNISSLQDALNRIPAIPVAGKTLKFVFSGDTWRGQVNGADTLSGTLAFVAAEGGGVITLKPTHAYFRGRQIPTPGVEIFLEYKAGPPMSLRAMSKSEVAATGVSSDAAAIALPPDDWQALHGPGCTAQSRVDRETIDGEETDVLTVTVKLRDKGWAASVTTNDDIVEKLRNATGVRLKTQGDGRPWQLVIGMPETSSDGGSYRADIKTKKGAVVAVDIPFSKLKQPGWGKRVKFNRDSIDSMGIEKGAHQGAGASTIKVFDIEVY